MSSVASLFSAPGTTIYSMSKAAISSLTDGIRRELYNKGVEVIEIIPQAYKFVIFILFTIILITTVVLKEYID